MTSENSEVVAEICAKIHEMTQQCGPDHHLFVPYKRKHLKVEFVDHSAICYIDESEPVEKIVADICVHHKISMPEEFSLQAANVWLNHKKSLSENGVSDDQTVFLKRKYFWEDRNVTLRDPISLHLLYSQSIENVVKDIYPTTQQEAVKLAILQLLVAGPYEKKMFTSTFLAEPSTYLPSKFQKDKKIHKEVEQGYITLTKETPNLDPNTAKYNYLKQCRLLKIYGVEVFKNVKEKYYLKKREVDRSVFIGVSRDSIIIYKPEDYSIYNQYKLCTLEKYHVTDNSGLSVLRLYLGNDENVPTFFVSDATRILEYISGMIDLTVYKRSRVLEVCEINTN